MTFTAPIPGWAATEIGAICSLINGKAFKPSDWSDLGLPIIRIQNLNNQNAPFNHFDGPVEDKFLVANRELLFAWSGTPGTSFGAHIWNGHKAVLNQHIFRVLFDETLIDKQFLRFAINQKLEELINKAHGGVGLRHVTKGKFEATEISIPPLNEQRRIVAKIEALMARSARAKEALDAIPALLDRYRQSVLAAAFRGDLTADWRAQHPDVEPASVLLDSIRAERRRKWMRTETERMRLRGRRVDGDGWKAKYVEPTAYPPPNGEHIPPSWAWTSVESLSTKVVDGVHKKPDYVERGTPFVTVRNLTAGPGINLSDLNHVSPEDHQEFIKRAHPESGDILISKDGTLGVVRAIRTNIEFSIFVSVAMIKPVDKKITDYLEWALSCPQVQQQMVGVGSGLQHIHLKDLRQDMLPIAPAQEQKVIVSRLKNEMEAINRLCELAGATKAQFSSLNQSILAKAFRGELVPQDPNDEPASALLARIKAERTAIGMPSRRGGRRKRAAAPVA